MNDKVFLVVAGPVSPKTDEEKGIVGKDMADYCKFQIKLKQGDPKWTFETQETKDGRLENWSGRGENDKWNFDNDEDARQDCKFDKNTFFDPGFNATLNNLRPSFTWSKLLVPADDKQDLAMAWNMSLPVYWKFKMGDIEKKGFFEGLFLDDPMNPTLSGAKTLMAGMASAAALAYATLA